MTERARRSEAYRANFILARDCFGPRPEENALRSRVRVFLVSSQQLVDFHREPLLGGHVLLAPLDVFDQQMRIALQSLVFLR